VLVSLVHIHVFTILDYFLNLPWSFIIKVIFRRLYATNAANDKCTLFSDRNLINRRNVVADVTKAYAPNKQMLLLAVKARIVAAAIVELGMETVHGYPTKNMFQRSTLLSSHQVSEGVYLSRLAASIVDKYIINSRATHDILNDVLNVKEQQALDNLLRLPNGRFPCRAPGCDKSFR